MHKIRLPEARRSELLLNAIGFNLDIQLHIKGCPTCTELDDPCPVAQAMLDESKRKSSKLESLGLLGD